MPLRWTSVTSQGNLDPPLLPAVDVHFSSAPDGLERTPVRSSSAAADFVMEGIDVEASVQAESDREAAEEAERARGPRCSLLYKLFLLVYWFCFLVVLSPCLIFVTYFYGGMSSIAHLAAMLMVLALVMWLLHLAAKMVIIDNERAVVVVAVVAALMVVLSAVVEVAADVQIVNKYDDHSVPDVIAVYNTAKELRVVAEAAGLALSFVSGVVLIRVAEVERRAEWAEKKELRAVVAVGSLVIWLVMASRNTISVSYADNNVDNGTPGTVANPHDTITKVAAAVIAVLTARVVVDVVREKKELAEAAAAALVAVAAEKKELAEALVLAEREAVRSKELSAALEQELEASKELLAAMAARQPNWQMADVLG
jgi:hypothetical protein